jgi:GntR family transcriptional regulator
VQPLADFAPLYAQIAAKIRGEIATGELRAGSRLASEHSLAERFGVGRPTVRQATQLLVTDGVLQRRRGSGTYVRAPEPKLDLLAASGTLEALARSGVATTTRVLGSAVRLRLSAESRAPFGDQDAFWVRRLSLAEDVPVLLEDIYFSTAVFPNLDRVDVAQRSLSLLARDEFGLVARSMDQRFRVAALDAARCELLGLSAGSPVLVVERTVHFNGAPNAVFSVLHCQTAEAEFTQRLELDTAGTALVPVLASASPSPTAEAPL